MQAACTFFKTGAYLSSRLNFVTNHNSKLTRIFMSYSTRNFINHSEYESDFFLRNIGYNIPEYSYDPGNDRKK